MIDLELEFDEGIILQCSDVERYGSAEDELEEMILTNKNIICITEKSTGLFSKTKTEITKIPLKSIKVINGQSQIMQVKNDNYGLCLQIVFTHGREYFVFQESPKKEIPKWIIELNKLIAGVEVPVVKNKQHESAIGGFSSFVTSIKNDADSTIQKTISKVNQVSNSSKERSAPINESINPEPIQDNTPPPQSQGSFCPNCGIREASGAKFCCGCGNPIGDNAKPPVLNVSPSPISQTSHTPPPTNTSKRHQEYAGVILKCPNCGGTITQTAAICPECGFRITGQTTVGSVQAFKDQFMAIENSRKGGLNAALGMYFVDKTDTQKLSLIRSFPIPNSIDDILEFLMLAITSIDVGLSKNTVMNRWNNSAPMDTGYTIGRKISNAWVAKMEQMYRKAEIAFPNDPAFAVIQRMYFDKMKELNIKM